MVIPLKQCADFFAYGIANAIAIPKAHHSDWFYLAGTGLPRLSWKPLNRCNSNSG